MVRKILSLIISATWIICNTLYISADDNDTYLSEEIQGYCVEIGEMYGVCPELLMAIIERESSGNPNAKNGSCKGLMQVSTKWHKSRMERLGVEDIFDMYGNILVGTDYIMELAEEYGDVAIVIGKYHGEKNPQEKISAYTRGILERSEQLERIHDK